MPGSTRWNLETDHLNTFLGSSNFSHNLMHFSALQVNVARFLVQLVQSTHLELVRVIVRGH